MNNLFFCIPILVLQCERNLCFIRKRIIWLIFGHVTFDLLIHDLDLLHSTRYTQDTSSVKISGWYFIGKMVKSCWLTDSLTHSPTKSLQWVSDATQKLIIWVTKDCILPCIHCWLIISWKSAHSHEVYKSLLNEQLFKRR